MAVLRQESEICRLKKGDRVGLIACSDARPDSDREKIGKLCGILRNAGLKPVCGDLLFGENGQTAPAKERARELMGFYRDPSVRAIFDVSGGNLANGLLPWLDFRAIAESEKLFWGYSDLTALIGAILSRSGRPSALWQIRNLLEDDPAAGGQLQRFIGSVLGEGCSLFAPECRMLRGARMEGVAAGGNIRCLLKSLQIVAFTSEAEKINNSQFLQKGNCSQREIFCASGSIADRKLKDGGSSALQSHLGTETFWHNGRSAALDIVSAHDYNSHISSGEPF